MLEKCQSVADRRCVTASTGLIALLCDMATARASGNGEAVKWGAQLRSVLRWQAMLWVGDFLRGYKV